MVRSQLELLRLSVREGEVVSGSGPGRGCYLCRDPECAKKAVQGRRIALPQYSVVATRGEAHEQMFEVECVIPELRIRSVGAGTSRRSAEQEAARDAYELASRM